MYIVNCAEFLYLSIKLVSRKTGVCLIRKYARAGNFEMNFKLLIFIIRMSGFSQGSFVVESLCLFRYPQLIMQKFS